MQMAVPESRSRRSRLARAPWLPIWSLVFGLVIFGAMVLGGDVAWGLVSLGLFVAFAALFYFGSRNETIGGLSAPGLDERWAMINERARAFAGTVVILAVIGGWVYELANGHDGSPYSELMGAAAIAYFVAAMWLRHRS